MKDPRGLYFIVDGVKLWPTDETVRTLERIAMSKQNWGKFEEAMKFQKMAWNAMCVIAMYGEQFND